MPTDRPETTPKGQATLEARQEIARCLARRGFDLPAERLIVRSRDDELILGLFDKDGWEDPVPVTKALRVRA